ncbi:MAG: PepSY domain-containing protein [Magnetospirillum gryphiswaldense]|nr:PepSY domain-containing protein [Magnetospirillum gryphiswaldense]
MRADIVRTYKAVHTWTGITTGLLLFVAFYAGALTMFKAPLQRWSEPVVLAAAMDVPADELIARTLAQHPDVAKDFTVHLDGPMRVSWQKSRRDTEPMVATPGADGGVVLRQDRNSGLDWLVDIIHRTAGLPVDLELGTAITGLAAALYAVALVSGLIILLPSLLKDLFALRLGKNVKRLWLDAHNLVGLVSLPFHLVMAFTAVVFGWHDFFYDTLDQTVYQGRMAAVMRIGNPAPPFAGNTAPAPTLGVVAILARSAEIAPGLQPTAVEYRNFGTRAATVRVVGHDPRYLVRGHGFLSLDGADGAVLNREYLPGQQGVWSAVVSSFFALHFGAFGGETVRWGYFFLGLSGAFLFYSGNLLWIESRRRLRRGQADIPTQSRSSRVMASLSIGVCLGCVAGLSAAIVSARLLQGVFVDVNGWSRAVYYLVFVLALALALRRGAAMAAPLLLWAAAAVTAAIPLTSLLLWRSAVPGVDVLALCGAAGLVALARKSARRAALGPADSVWSAARMDDRGLMP